MSRRPNLLAGEDLPPAPQQKRSLAKQARLKAAGLALFGERGYGNTSVDDIARRARLAVGTFYQHFRSKRQLLLVLMDELLEGLSRLEFRPGPGKNVRGVVHGLLSAAFARDLHYLGAYRAWQEAVLGDADFARKEEAIHAWTTTRVTIVFKRLHRLPGARRRVDISALARAMDGFFWSLLAQAVHMRKVELDRWVQASTHLIFHALFEDLSPRA